MPINSLDNSKQSVIIEFDYGFEDLVPLHDLEELLRKAIEDTSTGIYDGHEIAIDDSDGYLYMYGPNAENLFKAVRPILNKCDFMKGAVATLRFGPPSVDCPQIDITLE
jgi:hypothetical protein